HFSTRPPSPREPCLSRPSLHFAPLAEPRTMRYSPTTSLRTQFRTANHALFAHHFSSHPVQDREPCVIRPSLQFAPSTGPRTMRYSPVTSVRTHCSTANHALGANEFSSHLLQVIELYVKFPIDHV